MNSVVFAVIMPQLEIPSPGIVHCFQPSKINPFLKRRIYDADFTVDFEGEYDLSAQ